MGHVRGTGLPGPYQSPGFALASDAVFGGTSAAVGTGLELTTSWGFRGGYTHNWDPYWNTAIYGACAAVQCNAKALISTNIAAVAVAGTGFSCDPNFNIAQVGVITPWTPVKNLTFSADLAWSHLDQKYAGAVAIPAMAGIAKPAGNYELKDQSAVSLLLRAQRNW